VNLLFRRLPPWLLAVAAGASLAQPPGARLDEVIEARIGGDRSDVCIQAARIDLAATPAVTTAQACATARSDAPAADARFEIGSISKAFVELLAAEMIARGELRLDEPLSALLPKGASAPTFDGRPIVLADLLTHTSGLPPLPPSLGPGANPANPYAHLRADVIYDGLGAVKLASAPGTRYGYSNWAFLMLSDLLAQRAGRPYDVLLAERVLAPLGLKDTVVARNERLGAGRMANGRTTPHWDVPVAYAGAGGIRSTLADLVRLARAMLGDIPEGVPASLRSALATSRAPLRAAHPQLDVAMAWHLRKDPGGATRVFHNGMTGGFSSMLLLDVDGRRAAITLADAAGGFDDLAFHMLDPARPLLPPRRRVALDLPAARAALGRYELAPGFVLTLALDGDRLYAQATGQGRFELRQDSRGDYYALVADILIRIQRDADGKATALTLFQGGGATPARRLGD
jgi:D-alanyl-D-alanine-carboxypeptidase/D-alanyl-D-alanine-endopeptidase